MTQAPGLFPACLVFPWADPARRCQFWHDLLRLQGFTIHLALHDVVPRSSGPPQGVVNSISWLGAGTATVTIAAASQRFGMSACISAISLVYLFFGLLLLWGVARFMSGRTLPVASTGAPISATE
jgi:hypothetical protein